MKNREEYYKLLCMRLAKLSDADLAEKIRRLSSYELCGIVVFTIDDRLEKAALRELRSGE